MGLDVADSSLPTSLRSVSVIAGVLGRAGERGQKRRRANAKVGLCTWENPADVDAFIRDQMSAQKERGGTEEKSEEREGALEDGALNESAAPPQ